MRFRTVIAVAICGLIFLGVYGVLGRIEQSREADPSGRYFAVWSHAPYRYLPLVGLGTDSDSPCLVKIVGDDGRNYGEIPVANMQLAGVAWKPSGAEIQSIGEWDFAAGTCFYWSEDQLGKISVR